MKKLLILGSYHTELEIVRRAHDLGFYTIVTDNHHAVEHIPAKALADECWDISWTDIDALEAKCCDAGVDGVVAGFSERRVESMIKLTTRLGLPCSLTMEQLDVTRDKLKFKNACREGGIPCVPEFKYDDDIKFPVIVKPVDRAGSIGINVAYDKDSFEKDYAYAMSLSETKQVIIEEYINDGIKFDVYYYVQDGNIVFLGSSDTIMCKGKDGAEILQKAWPFPSKYEKQFLSDEDAHVRAMINNLGIDNCYLTMSAFYRDRKFYFFEAGFRLSGEMSFNYYKAVSGMDYLDVFIRYALGEKESLRLEEVKNQGKKSVILNFFGKDGKVCDIQGIDKVKSLPTVIDFLLYVRPGENIVNETKVFKKIAMCTICADNMGDLENTVKYVNETLVTTDKKKTDLIYERLSLKQLKEYYSFLPNNGLIL